MSSLEIDSLDIDAENLLFPTNFSLDLLLIFFMKYNHIKKCTEIIWMIKLVQRPSSSYIEKVLPPVLSIWGGILHVWTTARIAFVNQGGPWAPPLKTFAILVDRNVQKFTYWIYLFTSKWFSIKKKRFQRVYSWISHIKFSLNSSQTIFPYKKKWFSHKKYMIITSNM